MNATQVGSEAPCISRLIADWWKARPSAAAEVISIETSPEQRHAALIREAARAMHLAMRLKAGVNG
jgi:hypothetical protein